jgi:hypothetical protein
MHRMTMPILPWLAMLAAIIAAFGVAGQATAQTEREPRMQPLPILVMNCEADPGNLTPGGGRGTSPEKLEETHRCTRAEGVAVTVYNLDIDFHARCDTDAEGMCEIEAPPDPARRLTVVEHLATVASGYAPKEPVSETVHYTEFTGVGIVNLPVAEGTPEPDAERQVLSVNIATCADGSDAEGCERAPADALAQVSPGDITSEGVPWLATNDEGWVSFDIGGLPDGAIDLMIFAEQQMRVACTDRDADERLQAELIDGREGTFVRITPISDGEITCDVTLLGRAGAS